MKIKINLDGIDKIQRNIDAVEKAIITPQIGANASLLLIDVKYILIAIKEAAEAKGK